MWRWACALALLCAAFARSSALKRAEMSAAPFILSSRYGRSPPRIIEPRNDRFFMGSRYGKRSEPLLEASHRTLQTLPDVTLRDIMLLCELKTFAPLCPHLQISPKVIYKSIVRRREPMKRSSCED